MELDVGMLVATLFKNKIQCAVNQCCEKVITHLRIGIKPYRTNAPLLSTDLPCSDIWMEWECDGAGRPTMMALVVKIPLIVEDGAAMSRYLHWQIMRGVCSRVVVAPVADAMAWVCCFRLVVVVCCLLCLIEMLT